MAKKDNTVATAPKAEEQPQPQTVTDKPQTLAAKLLHIKASIGKIGKDGSSIVGGKTAPAKTCRQSWSALCRYSMMQASTTRFRP